MHSAYLMEVTDFKPESGWDQTSLSQASSQAYCEALEDGKILFLPSLPCSMPVSDREFLYALDQTDSAIHKNISYRPNDDILRGYASGQSENVQTLHRIMRDYSTGVIKMLSQLLAPYAMKWSLDYASYRPYEEENRNLPLHKRNDLVHTDAFPSRPTHGGLILRCFTNVNPSQPRVWSTTERFGTLAARMANDAGLREMVERETSPWQSFRKSFNSLKGSLGIRGTDRSTYDEFMLKFHDYLKENTDFQTTSEKFRTDFPPLSTWITFTDIVPHAVLSGRYALEQTFIVPTEALFDASKSPVRVLEGIAGKSLVSLGKG